MSSTLAKNGGGVRLNAVDLLRGLILLLVALDFTRYYAFGGGDIDPTNLATTTAPLFFTRCITHFFVPVFLLLAGISAYFKGQGGISKKQLSVYLLTRGAFVIALEILVVGFLWKFQINIFPIFFQFVWILGLSMAALAALIWLPLRVIAGISLLVMFGHNLLDGFTLGEGYWQNILWGILHEEAVVCADICSKSPDEIFYAFISYPLLPWGAVMGLGYSLGGLYKMEPARRQKFLAFAGALTLVLFVIVRGVNGYGNSMPWAEQKNAFWTVMSFLNAGKYPPSLSYLLMTLGPAFLLLGWFEKVKMKGASFLQVFGRVPLFFYVLSLLLAHTVALVLGVFQGFPASDFLVGFWRFPEGFGVSLFWVYLLWATVVVLLYPICEWYADLRARKSNSIFTYL